MSSDPPSPSSFPEVVHQSAPDAHTRRYTLAISPELPCFAGHFESLPILAGVVQIDWAARLATQAFPLPAHFVGIDTVKFTRLIGPGVRIELTLTHHPHAGSVDFCYTDGPQTCSTGRLRWEV